MRLNKSLWIKYKLNKSVFESLNAAAYATQSRPLGTSNNVVRLITSNSTLCEMILPNLIGVSPKSENWDREKADYISNLQLIVPSSGYKLKLGASFDVDDYLRKDNIKKYIEDNNLYDDVVSGETKPDVDAKGNAIEKPIYNKVVKSTSEILKAILNDSNVEVIDYHKYFKYDDTKDYLFWILATYSSQVANSPEDADKSPNIRFFLFDEKIAEKIDLENTNFEIEAINKITEIKNGKSSEILEDITLVLGVVDFESLLDVSSDNIVDYCYSKLFKYAKSNPKDILEELKNKDYKIKASIKRYIDKGLIDLGEDGELKNTITNGSIGINMTSALAWFKNPINEGERNKLETKYKSLK